MEKSPNILGLFQDRGLDLSGYSRGFEMYTQNTKTVSDTLKNPRIDVYMPWKPVLLDNFDIMHEITALKLDGTEQEDNGVGTVYAALSAAFDQIESLQFLHGNGSGEIIYQISNNAFAYL